MSVTIIPATKNVNAESTDKYHQLRVAAYCRVSTEQEEQQNSYQVQIDYYTDLINQNKEWVLAGIFADEGISGTQTKKRTEFNKMIRLCKKRKIDLVLCKSISRFARNTVDTLEYVRQLKELGIAVIFEKENINTMTMTSEFMIALYGSFAQAESESISKNVSWGIEKAFREGKVKYNLGRLYGYRKGADGKPEIVPEEAKVIKLIYKLYLDGLTLSSFNFIPSCHVCNSLMKGDKYVETLYPYEDSAEEDIRFDIVLKNGQKKKNIVDIWLGKGKNSFPEIKKISELNVINLIKAKDDAKKTKGDRYREKLIDNEIELFHLKEIYKNHLDQAVNVLLIMRIYLEEYFYTRNINSICKNIGITSVKNGTSITKEEIRSFLLGLVIDGQGEMDKPLAKMISDIYNNEVKNI